VGRKKRKGDRGGELKITLPQRTHVSKGGKVRTSPPGKKNAALTEGHAKGVVVGPAFPSTDRQKKRSGTNVAVWAKKGEQAS